MPTVRRSVFSGHHCPSSCRLHCDGSGLTLRSTIENDRGPDIGRQAAGCDNEERAACRRRARLRNKEIVPLSNTVASLPSPQAGRWATVRKPRKSKSFPTNPGTSRALRQKLSQKERGPGVHRRLGVKRSGTDLGDKKQGRGGEDNNAGGRQAFRRPSLMSRPVKCC
jgi:hypothetical protein